jgi:hypothetical protein
MKIWRRVRKVQSRRAARWAPQDRDGIRFFRFKPPFPRKSLICGNGGPDWNWRQTGGFMSIDGMDA